MPRQPILSVLGHVDSGKTSLLDFIRESKITGGEAGGITQMIGATEVPLETVEDVCGDLLKQLDTEITIPGLMFIDTPGHAAFSSLRKRGGSISDIAVLVIDIRQGIQPQTEEAISILKESGTPFVIALNKIDTLHGWNSESKIFSKNIKNQNERNVNALDEKVYEVMGNLHEDYGITADRFDRVDDFQNKVAMVPISAMTGEGIPELLMVLTGLSQNYLKDRLEVHEGMGRATVLEVAQEEGLGTTIDVIHYDGTIEKDEKLVYGTADGVKVTDIRALLEPKPLKEIRVDKQYDRTERVEPASGIKVVGKDMEGVISGAPVRTADPENLEEAKEEVSQELGSMDFKTQKHGVVVKADSLGSLEAVMRELDDIPVQKAEVGPVTKSDVIEIQNEKPEERAILAFNVKVTEQAHEDLQNKGLEIFRSDVIYEIVENYEEWKEDLKKRSREEKLNSISRPAKIRVMPDHVFNRSKPAVVGVKIVEGVLTAGSSIMNMDGERIGIVKSVQAENEKVDKAERGDEVAVSISNATVGRSFEEGDTLIVDVSGDDYTDLRDLIDLLTDGEKNILEEIVEVKDKVDPHWKIG